MGVFKNWLIKKLKEDTSTASIANFAMPIGVSPAFSDEETLPRMKIIKKKKKKKSV